MGSQSEMEEEAKLEVANGCWDLRGERANAVEVERTRPKKENRGRRRPHSLVVPLGRQISANYYSIIIIIIIISDFIIWCLMLLFLSLITLYGITGSANQPTLPLEAWGQIYTNLCTSAHLLFILFYSSPVAGISK